MAQTVQQDHREDLRSGRALGLRSVPGLPLRAGRHLTAWVVWHTTRVSLLDDAPESDTGGTARPVT